MHINTSLEKVSIPKYQQDTDTILNYFYSPRDIYDSVGI